MPRTQTSRKPGGNPAPIRVLRCRHAKRDGYPLNDEHVVLRIVADAVEREYQRIADAWESGEPYAIEIAGRVHVGTVKGNIHIRENGSGKWIVLFDLHEDPKQWQTLLTS